MEQVCACDSPAILFSLAVLAGGLLLLLAAGSLGFNVIRTIRFLQRNTLRLVTQPREKTGGGGKATSGGGGGIAHSLWVGLLFAVLLAVVGASLYVIGGGL